MVNAQVRLIYYHARLEYDRNKALHFLEKLMERNSIKIFTRSLQQGSALSQHQNFQMEMMDLRTKFDNAAAQVCGDTVRL